MSNVIRVGAEDIAEAIAGKQVEVKRPRRGLFGKSPIYVVEEKKALGLGAKIAVAALALAPFAAGCAAMATADNSSVDLGERLAQGNESPLSLGLTTDVLSRYMFRGFTYSEGSVVQLVPIATRGNVSLVGFVNHDNASGDVNEADLTVDYTRQLGKLGLSVGYTYLTFPNTPLNETQELYLIASLDTPAKPTLKVFRDIDDIKGTYVEAILSHDFDIKGLPLSVTALLAYNDNFLREGSGFSHADLKLASPLKLTDRLTIIPNIRYSHALEETNFEDMVYGGVSIEARF